ncbi:hypothetical protein RhiJN_27888 [Ceratobasidium sp. AG-Ba]|nr:hypothetical protein RhiJN_27888 [Ceratobasidium sp. AG-Ba]
MQFLQPFFVAFAILTSFLSTSPAPGGLAAIDPPATWRTTLSRAVIEYGPVTGTLVTTTLQFSTAEDLVLYTYPVGSFVWGSTLPAVHAWGRNALRFVGGRVSSVTILTSATLGSIVRASIDAHDALYRGYRAWYFGNGATCVCAFTHVRSKLPRPVTLGLPAPPRWLTLPASAPVHPAYPILLTSKILLPTSLQLQWLVSNPASNILPIPVSLAPRTLMLTWEVPEDRRCRFLRRVRISDSPALDNSITEQQMLAVVLFFVLWTLLGDLITFGLDRGYILYLLNGVGIGCTLLERLLDDDVPECDEEAECFLDSGDGLSEAPIGESAPHINEPNPSSPSDSESNAIPLGSDGLDNIPAAGSASGAPVVEDATDDGLVDQVVEPAQATLFDRQLTPIPPIDDGYAEPPSPPVLAAVDSTKAQPAIIDHPAERPSSVQIVESSGSSHESVMEPAKSTSLGNSETTPASLANEDIVEVPTPPAEGPWEFDLFQMMEAAKQRQVELKAVFEPSGLTPKAPRKVEPVIKRVVESIVPKVATESKLSKRATKVQSKHAAFCWSQVYTELDWAEPGIEETAWVDDISLAEPEAVIPTPASASTPALALTPTLTAESVASTAPSSGAESKTAEVPAMCLSPEAEPATEVDQSLAVDSEETPAVDGEEMPAKKKRTRGVRGGKSKRRYLQQQAESVGTEVENGRTEAATGVERGPSSSRWFIRPRRETTIPQAAPSILPPKSTTTPSLTSPSPPPHSCLHVDSSRARPALWPPVAAGQPWWELVVCARASADVPSGWPPEAGVWSGAWPALDCCRE